MAEPRPVISRTQDLTSSSWVAEQSDESFAKQNEQRVRIKRRPPKSSIMPGGSRERRNQDDLIVLRGAAILKAQMNDRLGASPMALQYTHSATTVSEFSDPFAKQRSNQQQQQVEQRQNSIASISSNPADQRSFGEYIDDEAESFFDYYGGESYGEELEYCGDVVEDKEDEEIPDTTPAIQLTSYTFAERGNFVVVSPDGKCRERHNGAGRAAAGSSSSSSSRSSSSNSDPHVLSSKELGRLSQELKGLGGGGGGEARTSKAKRKPSPTHNTATHRTSFYKATEGGHRNVTSSSNPHTTKSRSRHNSQRPLYQKILNDPAYSHSAGFLWQSLVSQHMKLPKLWWNGRRGPPLGSEEDRPWMYVSRDTVKQRILSQLVRGRASAGRILLHIVVQDILTHQTLQDIAVGCFHPNARGIRETTNAMTSLEEYRDIWVAVRKHSDSVSAVESLLLNLSQPKSRSPLGPGIRVDNTNVRAVFGERPPLETLRMCEDELYERVAFRMTKDSFSASMAILHEFVFA